jgi:maltose alpha-D-glucosyltransferase/alpha-amylase
MQTPRSFVSQLAKILSVRKGSQIAEGDLIAVPQVTNKSALLLLHRIKENGFFHLLAVNFSRRKVHEKLEMNGIQDTWALDLMSGLAENKGFESGVFFFDLPPLSGKVFLFQPKYYETQ